MTAGVPPTWPALIGRLLAGQDLAAGDTEWAMDQVMSGEASPAQVAGFVVALRAKGETAPEIAGLATAMLAHARAVEVPPPVVDIVGTGGDGAHTVNISTMSAVVMAAAGARVVKHGGRAASSQSGSVDVLEALGVPVDLGPDAVAHCVAEVGIGFCFAQVFHPAMRHAGPVRGQLGVPTAFNLLGPLTNPARPGAALIGCADVRFAPILAEVLAARGDRAVVVRGDDGLDEVTTATTTTVWHAGPAGVRVETLDPAALGVPASGQEALRGGDAAHNAAVARAVFAGEAGAVRDAVLLNAGAALAAHEEAVTGTPMTDLHAGVAAGQRRAAEAVDSGAAAALLDRWSAVAREARG
ncbi:anthranilate phosphoribosyltransferase [Actinomycetospora sp. C-140]